MKVIVDIPPRLQKMYMPEELPLALSLGLGLHAIAAQKLSPQEFIALFRLSPKEGEALLKKLSQNIDRSPPHGLE